MGGRTTEVGDFRDASTAEFRDAVVAWIDARRSELEPPYCDHGSTEELLSHQRRVQQLLFDHGFMRWGWPVEVGGLGGNPLFRAVLGEELTGRGLVHSAAYSMTEVLGPAVIAYADAALAAQVVPPLLRGDETWCQGFSEPEAGSDLGSLRTTARPGRRRVGDPGAEALDELGPPCHPMRRLGTDRGPRNRLHGDQRVLRGHGLPRHCRAPAGNDGRGRRILRDVLRRGARPRPPGAGRSGGRLAGRAVHPGLRARTDLLAAGQLAPPPSAGDRRGGRCRRCDGAALDRACLRRRLRPAGPLTIHPATGGRGRAAGRRVLNRQDPDRRAPTRRCSRPPAMCCTA